MEREQGVGHGAYALLVFVLPLVGAAALEATLALLSDRWPRRRVAALALLATAIALGICAFQPGHAALVVGLTVAGGASGIACAAAQAELVTNARGAGERAMARWVLFGAAGDVLTPVLAAFVLALGGSYRAVFALVGACSLAHAGLLAASRSRRMPAAAGAASTDGAGDAEAGASLLEGLREGLRNRWLWLWLFGASMCSFLDELVVALGALHAERHLGASPAAAAACVTGMSVGVAAGAWLTERLSLCVSSLRLAIGSALGSLLSLAALIVAPSPIWLGVALVSLGAAAAPQYAILQARAYAAAPGRPGVVNALAQVFVIVEVIGPLALGALADAWGVAAALAALAVQPLAVLLIMRVAKPATPTPAAAEALAAAPEHEAGG